GSSRSRDTHERGQKPRSCRSGALGAVVATEARALAVGCRRAFALGRRRLAAPAVDIAGALGHRCPPTGFIGTARLSSGLFTTATAHSFRTGLLGRPQHTRTTLSARQRLGCLALHAVDLFLGLGLHVRQRYRLETHLLTEDVAFRLGHFTPAAHRQIGCHEHRSEAHTLQAADHQALGLPQTTNLAVTPFHHHAVIPVVEAFAAGCLLDVREARRAIFAPHAGLPAPGPVGA